MRKLLLLCSAALMFYACKDAPTDPGSGTAGCGSGMNPDSLTQFTLTGSPFGTINWDSVSENIGGFTIRRIKDGRSIHTVIAGYSERSNDTSFYLSVSFPAWKSGGYSGESLSSSKEGVGAVLTYMFYDPVSQDYVIHNFYSTSGGTTINVSGQILPPKDTATVLGTFCGTLTDSLGNVVTLENGLVHYRSTR